MTRLEAIIACADLWNMIAHLHRKLPSTITTLTCSVLNIKEQAFQKLGFPSMLYLCPCCEFTDPNGPDNNSFECSDCPLINLWGDEVAPGILVDGESAPCEAALRSPYKRWHSLSTATHAEASGHALVIRDYCINLIENWEGEDE